MFGPRARPPLGYSLIELLIVVAIIGILARVVVTSSDPTLHDRLQTAARLVATDLGVARNLAIARGSQHRFTFDLTANRYTLTHSGTNTALNTLPATPFGSKYDTTTQQVTDLDELPGLSGGVVRLSAVRRQGTINGSISVIEFDVYGQTLIPDDSVVWLEAGAGTGRRYLTVRVNPTTGLASIESFGATGPPSP